jgi:hypothetical protein
MGVSSFEPDRQIEMDQYDDLDTCVQSITLCEICRGRATINTDLVKKIPTLLKQMRYAPALLHTRLLLWITCPERVTRQPRTLLFVVLCCLFLNRKYKELFDILRYQADKNTRSEVPSASRLYDEDQVITCSIPLIYCRCP